LNDQEAAREVLKDQAFAYVERLEDEVRDLRHQLELKDKALDAALDQFAENSAELKNLRKSIKAAQGNFEGGLLQALQDEIERGLALSQAVDAATVNLEAGNAVTNKAAALRNLREGLSKWTANRKEPPVARGRDGDDGLSTS
jgi:DNA repair exonuclease SbcCD ATPase subunit